MIPSYYDEDARKCIKCDSYPSVTEKYINPEKAEYHDYLESLRKEGLNDVISRECDHCGFIWHVKCRDAKEKK